MKLAIQLPSDDGITGNEKPLNDAVPWRRKSRRSNLDKGGREQALQARGCSSLAMSLRVRAGGRARQANTYSLKAPKLRRMSNDRNCPTGQVAPPPIQVLATYDRSLLGSEQQVLSRLWRSRHLGLFALDRRRGWINWLGMLRAGHGRKARWPHLGAAGCESRLRAEQLHLGIPYGPSSEQAQRAANRVPRRKPTYTGVGRAHRHPIFYAIRPPQEMASREGVDRARRQIDDHLAKLKGWLT